MTLEQEPVLNRPQGPESVTQPSTMDKTKEQAAHIADQAREVTGDLVNQATEQAKPRLESSKGQAVQTLASTAQALRRTGAEMQDQQGGRISQVADGVAGQTERIAEFLGSRDVGQLVQEAEQFARRQPALFLGAAFTLGLVGARFLRTSAANVEANSASSARTWPTQGEPGSVAFPQASLAYTGEESVVPGGGAASSDIPIDRGAS